MGRFFRTRRGLRAERASADGVEVVASVVRAAAEAIAGYSRLVVPYPLRTLRCRTIEITRRRARLIKRARVESCELLDDRGDAGRIVDDESPTALDLLAETLLTAVEFGIVSGEDAELVWVTRHPSDDLQGSIPAASYADRFGRERCLTRLNAPHGSRSPHNPEVDIINLVRISA